MTVVRDQLFPQKPPGSRFRFSRTGVQPSPGSSTIELPSAFAESGAYPHDREPPGSPRQCSLPLACRHPPEGHQIGARKRRTPENTILSQPYCRRVSTNRSDREGSQLAASLEGEPGPTPAGKTLPHSYPETRFRRERARDSAFDSRAQGFSPPLTHRRSSCPPPSPNLVRTYPIELYQALHDSVPCLSRVATPPEGRQIGAWKRRAPGNTILSQPYRRRVSTDRLNREGSQLAASLEGEPGPTPAGKTLPHLYNQFSEGEGTR